MRKTILLIMLMAASHQLMSQTYDEWFRQKKTQVKYLLQQIAANQIYIGYLQKGYKIARTGLNTINDIKHGDFNLHSAFFDSLRIVNPKIKSWSKVADIVSIQLQIIKETKSAIQQSQTSKQFTSSELTYLQNVFSHFLDEFSKDIDVLLTVTTSGKIEMTDDERIKRIDALYDDMQDKLLFSKSFSDDAIKLAVQRHNEQTDIEISKQLNALP